MARLLGFLLVCILVAWVVRRVWIAVLQLRVGAIPDDVDVPAIPLVADRGWQLSRTIDHGIATIRVEHPSEGVAREWTLHLREPGARSQLEDIMGRASRLLQSLQP